MKSRAWAPPVWLSLALLAGTLAYLLTQWHAHPAPGSQIVGPVILLISGICVILMLEGVSYLSGLQLKGETNRHLSPEANERLTQVTLDVVRIIELTLALPFAAGTVLGLGERGGIHPLFALMAIGGVGVGVVIACRRLVACAHELHERGQDQGLEGWNGIIYSNKSDPRIWVPKIAGIGYTLNFAHSRSWLILGLLVSPAVLVAILGVVVKICSGIIH